MVLAVVDHVDLLHPSIHTPAGPSYEGPCVENNYQLERKMIDELDTEVLLGKVRGIGCEG